MADHDRTGEPAYDPYVVDSTSPGEPSSLRIRSRLLLVAAAVAAFALVGVGAYAVANLVTLRGADPAERLPDSAIFYLDVNLYPGDDGEARLGQALNTLGLDGFSADLESGLAELLATLGVENIEAADVLRWIGTRAAVAVYDTSGSADDDLTVTLAIASRDDRAARETLADIWDASDEEFGYVVDDGLVVLTIADHEPQAFAEEIVAVGRATPMAEHEPFQSGLDQLGGERYLATAWVDISTDSPTVDADLSLSGGANLVDPSSVLGTDSIVIGAQAIDGGLEARFTTGERGDGPGRSDWLEQVGETVAAPVAFMVTLPADIGESGELRDDLIRFVDDIYNAPLPFLDEFERGHWDYDLALSDDELAEYGDLDLRWAQEMLSEDDPEFDRLVELEDAYWRFGLQSKWDHATEMGWLEDHLRINALDHDEYYELLRIEAEWGTPTVTDADEYWHFKAIRRLYSYGVESDHESYEADVSAEEVAELLLDYVSGLTITATADEVLGELQLGLAAEVADGRADRLHRLPRQVRDHLFDLVEASPRFDDSRVVFTELDGVDGTISDHPRFVDAFDNMPAEAVMALFVDLRTLSGSEPAPGDDPDFTVLSMVYGTDGTGTIRLLLDDDEPGSAR